MASTKRAAVITTIAALLLLPAAAHAQAEIQEATPHWGVRTFDAAVLRPLGFAALVVGAGLFVPAAILVAPSGKDNLETALEHFVLKPYQATFERPLGQL
jgi:hypothetical protein